MKMPTSLKGQEDTTAYQSNSCEGPPATVNSKIIHPRKFSDIEETSQRSSSSSPHNRTPQTTSDNHPTTTADSSNATVQNTQYITNVYIWFNLRFGNRWWKGMLGFIIVATPLFIFIGMWYPSEQTSTGGKHKTDMFHSQFIENFTVRMENFRKQFPQDRRNGLPALDPTYVRQECEKIEGYYAEILKSAGSHMDSLESELENPQHWWSLRRVGASVVEDSVKYGKKLQTDLERNHSSKACFTAIEITKTVLREMSISGPPGSFYPHGWQERTCKERYMRHFLPWCTGDMSTYFAKFRAEHEALQKSLTILARQLDQSKATEKCLASELVLLSSAKNSKGLSKKVRSIRGHLDSIGLSESV
jgi:hypothetical protein